MYRAEIEERAALLGRLGHGRDQARVRLLGNLDWDFSPAARPLTTRTSTAFSIACSANLRTARPPPAAKEAPDEAAVTWRPPWPCRLALGAVGCGVNEDLYNSTVKDRDAQKKKLADTETALDAEKARTRRMSRARDARVRCSPTS